MQIGPEIQDTVASLTIFQRSPHWAAPFEQFRTAVPEPLRFLLREVPLYQAWYRVRLGWTFNDRIHPALQKDPDWEHPERSLNAINDGHREYFTQYIVAELGDRTDLLDKVVPTYPPFGKRMLMDNGWYRMLRNEKVELVTDPIAEIGPDRVVTDDGSEYEADVLVIATGFDVLRFLTAVRGARSRRAARCARCGTTTTPAPTSASPCPTSRTSSASTGRTPSPATAAASSSWSRCRCATSSTSLRKMVTDGHRRRRVPPGRARRLQRRRRRGPREHGVDAPGHVDLLPQRPRSGRGQLPVPQRRPVRDGPTPRRPVGVRRRAAG